MRFVSTQMVQMIQAVSQNRTDKQITIEDLANIGRAAYLSVLGTAPLSYGREQYQTSYVIYYVRGEANNKASVIWEVYFENYCKADWTVYSAVNNSKKFSFVVKRKTNVNPSEITPNLKIKEGEVKIILECSMLLLQTNINTRTAFDFLIYSPRFYKLSNSAHRYFFTSILIFTPKPGLFFETPPPGNAKDRY